MKSVLSKERDVISRKGSAVVSVRKSGSSREATALTPAGLHQANPLWVAVRLLWFEAFGVLESEPTAYLGE